MFVRELNPYGYAVKAKKAVGYSMDAFIIFYRKMLDYILEVNRSDQTFAEAYTTLVLTKIQTPWPVGFVDSTIASRCWLRCGCLQLRWRRLCIG